MPIDRHRVLPTRGAVRSHEAHLEVVEDVAEAHVDVGRGRSDSSVAAHGRAPQIGRQLVLPLFRVQWHGGEQGK